MFLLFLGKENEEDYKILKELKFRVSETVEVVSQQHGGF